MTRRDSQRILDMVDATEKAIAFAAGKSREDLDENEMLALALVRLLEIIGEAARFVPHEVKQANPEVPGERLLVRETALFTDISPLTSTSCGLLSSVTCHH